MLEVKEIENTGIDPEIIRKAKQDIGEDDERREQTIKIIREWLKKQKHLTFPAGNVSLASG